MSWDDVIGGSAGLEPPAQSVSKRDGLRFDRALEVVLRGRGGVFTVRTRNISRSGVLLEISDPVVLHCGIEEFARAARKRFRTGADICFVGAELKVRADLARVQTIESAVLLGFEFRRTLDAATCRTIGIEDRDDGHEESF